jgi:hypothetical protein
MKVALFILYKQKQRATLFKECYKTKDHAQSKESFHLKSLD